jgi:glycosyltransferase involved in cell wall biosynthesis
VIDNLKVGGAQRVAVDLTNWLSAAGHQVAICAADGALSDEVESQGHWIRMPAPEARLAYFRTLSRAVGYWRPDIIHTHQRGVALLAHALSRPRRIAHIEHVHNVLPSPDHNRLSYLADSLIAVGSRVEQMIRVKYGRPQTKINIVPNAVIDRFGSARPFRNISGEAPIRLLAIGRLVEQKAPLRFVEVLKSLVDMGFSVDARWVGDGPLAQSVRAAVDSYGLADRLELAGEDLDIARHLEWCHALVLLSEWEGLPLVALEAMSAGRPVIARDVGSVADVVTESTGLLLPARLDAAGTAAGIARWSGERAAIRRLGTNARARYEDGYTSGVFMSRIEAVYRGVVGSRA